MEQLCFSSSKNQKKILLIFHRILSQYINNGNIEKIVNLLNDSDNENSKFATLYIPVVTLKSEDNTKLSKLLSEGFKRSIYWNKYQAILKDHAANKNRRERLDASFQGVSKLFILVYALGDNITDENSYRKYFLPRLKIKN